MNNITYSPSGDVKAEVDTLVNFTCTVGFAADGEGFKWCFALPNASKVECRSPRRIHRIAPITKVSYNKTFSSFLLNATEEMDGTVVQCQYGEMLCSKFSLLVVNSESESENIAVEDVE